MVRQWFDKLHDNVTLSLLKVNFIRSLSKDPDGWYRTTTKNQ
jgi:hypothetical protein